MKYKVYTTREFKRILASNGWEYSRSSGDHDIYVKAGKHISFPAKAKNLNPMVARRLIKENNLKEDV